MDTSRYDTLIPLPDELHSERLIIRPYRPDDPEQVFAAIDESRENLRPWLSWVEKHNSIDDTRDFCTRCAANWLLRTDLTVGIFDARDGRYLGGSGLHRFNWKVRAFEIAYWLRRSAEGEGYATETVRMLTQLAFEGLDARRVEIRCDPRNTRSRRIPEQLGFVLEGQLRNIMLDADGQPRTVLVYSLIPDDYTQIKASW